MQPKYLGIIIVVLVILVGAYFLLRGGYQTPASAPTQGPISAPAETKEPIETPTTQAPTSGITEISVVGTEFSFNPSSISVKAGERVKITFRNNGRAPHNLIIEGLDIGTRTIGGGQTDVVEFTAPTSGSYTFFCSVSGHRAAGMEGSLKVQELK